MSDKRSPQDNAAIEGFGSMFAPLIARAKTKAIAASTNGLQHRLSQPDLRSTEKVVGGENEGGAGTKNMTARETTRDLSSNFSKIPIYPPDWTNRTDALLPFSAQRTPIALQRKLVLGGVNDPLEHEADHVADQVIDMPHPGAASTSAPPQVSGKCVAREDEKLQKSEAGSRAAAPSIPEVLRSPGQPLDAATRAYMEPRLAHSFGNIRVRTDRGAADSAKSIGARAYTVGHDIVFGANEYQPASSEGRQLIAHELVHVLQQAKTPQADTSAPVSSASALVQRQPDRRQPDTGQASRSFHVTVKITMDDQVLNPPTSSPKITLPNELKNLLTKQVAAAFAPLKDDSLSISVEWGKFTAKELSTAGNVEVDLIPGADAFDAAQKQAKRYLLSDEDAIKFGGDTHEAGGVHWSQSPIPQDKLMGPTVVLVPNIFRDRVIQWSGKKATDNDKAPAELTIEYIGKSIEHEVGHAFGLPDVFNDINPPGAAEKNDKFPSQKPNVMDVLPLPNEKPFDEEMDWQEFAGTASDVGTRRRTAINAIRGPVVLPKGYAEKFLHDREQQRTFNEVSRTGTRIEILEDGRVVWFPAYDKFEFTREQLDEMRSFLHGANPAL
jgi:uncharacterized protein DUF4157